MVFKCNDGTQIKCKETPYYFTVIIDRKTWYWNKDTGEFDGWGETRLSSFPSPTPLPTPRLQNHQLV